MSPLYPILATLAYAVLLAGYRERLRRPRRHAALMGAGMALDLGLVLTLELTRNAVATALGHELTGAQRVHVAASTCAVALYFPVAVLGWRRLFGGAGAGARSWHRRLGYAALAFRTIGFLFMFAMLARA